MIYLDHNATTPIAPEVREAMRPYLEREFGNPSSAHAHGATAKAAVDRARSQLAALLGCESAAVVFCASGSEADNLAIKGAALARLGERDHLITSSIEPGTALVSVMHANNEVGTVQPIAEIAAAARERGVLVHTDAAQSVGKIAMDVDALGVDLLTVVGHKMYAPKGIGALFVRPGTRLDAVIHGGGHEDGLRAGTENVPYIVGLGAAAELAGQRLENGAHMLGVDIAETVFEPRAGGHIYDRGVNGSECRWARVLAYEPPDRLVFTWDISPHWQLESDPERASEVEVRFVAETPERTRVELEHRNLDRHGDGWEGLRAGVEAAEGWPLYLNRYAEVVAGSAPTPR